MPTPKRNRRMFIREALVILVFAVPSGTAEPQPQLDVTNRIAITQLRKELLADSKDEYQRLVSGDYLATRLDQIRQLVRKDIIRELNAGFENPGELNARLRLILQDDREVPTSSVLHRQLNGSHVVIVAYSILHGGSALPDATAVIEAFRKGTAQYDFIAQTGERLENRDSRSSGLRLPRGRRRSA
jgi:hypothetical protein